MMKAVVTLLFVSSAALAQQPPASVDMRLINCQSLMDFGAGRFDNDQVVFGLDRNNWTMREKSAVSSIQDRCTQAALSAMLAQHTYTTPKQQQLYAISERISDKASAIVSHNQSVADAEKKKANEDRQRAALEKLAADAQAHQERIAKFNACQETKEYKLYRDQENVIGDIEQIAEWKKNQARQAEIARESGVRDLAAERTVGESIVELRHDLSDSWAEYRKLGGKAASQGAVKHTLTDPCGDLSVQ